MDRTAISRRVEEHPKCSAPKAIELLATKIKNADASLLRLQDDLEFLREQITVREVNTTRSYSRDMVRRKGQRAMETTASTG